MIISRPVFYFSCLVLLLIVCIGLFYDGKPAGQKKLSGLILMGVDRKSDDLSPPSDTFLDADSIYEAGGRVFFKFIFRYKGLYNDGTLPPYDRVIALRSTACANKLQRSEEYWFLDGDQLVDHSKINDLSEHLLNDKVYEIVCGDRAS